jgi:twinkle protein
MAFIKTGLPCPDPRCGSSDAYAIDDNGWGKCFSCDGNFKQGSTEPSEEEFIVTNTYVAPSTQKRPTEPYRASEGITYKSLPARGLNINTMERFGVGYKGNDLVFPYGSNAAKVRINGEKQFTIKGEWSSYKGLFGQERFSAGGKLVIVTEGEIDAMSAFQMMDGKYPVVSVRNGAKAALKDCKDNFEFLDSFDSIYINFDADDPGEDAAKQVAELFNRKAKIVKMPNGYKDANDMLKDGKKTDYSVAVWRAEQYSPAGVVRLSQMWESFANDDANIKIPFPDSWSTLNEMMNGGTERGEVTVVGALTSIGKSTIVTNICYHQMENTDFKTGVLFLEGTQREVVRDILSLDLSTNLRRADRSDLDMNHLEKHWREEIAVKDNLILIDHKGSLSTESIISKINYLAKAEECDLIVIDPIQAALDSSDNAQVIQFMDAILKFAKETEVAVILVSHMRKPDGKDPHAVSEYDLLGSSSINQIAFNTILISRDKMAEDPVKKNATKLHLVKCRRTGETGAAGWLRYDVDTTHMYPMSNPYEADDAL